MIFRFLTSGESHGQSLNAIIEGVPAGVSIDENFINNELSRRQVGYGRGGRMQIEKDTIEIKSDFSFTACTIGTSDARSFPKKSSNISMVKPSSYSSKSTS